MWCYRCVSYVLCGITDVLVVFTVLLQLNSMQFNSVAEDGRFDEAEVMTFPFR